MKQFIKLLILLGLSFVLLVIVGVLFNFNYNNFLDTFNTGYGLGRNFSDFLLYGTFFFGYCFLVVLSEYFLFKETEEKFKYTLYLYFPTLLTIISGVIPIVILSLFPAVRSGWGALALAYFATIASAIIFVYGYLRLFALNLSLSSKTIFIFLDKHFRKITYLFFGIYLILVGVIIFSYTTQGQYIKFSNQSNTKYWQNKAEKNNDIKYCDTATSIDSCQLGFFNKEIQESNFKNANTTYNFLLTNQCNKTDESKNRCESLLVESLRQKVVSEVKSKLPYLPTGKLYALYWSPNIEETLELEIYKNRNAYTITDFIKKEEILKNKLPNLKLFTLYKGRTNDKMIGLKIPLREFLKKETNFYKVFNNEIYPVFYSDLKDSKDSKIIPQKNIFSKFIKVNEKLTYVTYKKNTPVLYLNLENISSDTLLFEKRTLFERMQNNKKIDVACDLISSKVAGSIQYDAISGKDEVALSPNKTMGLLYQCKDYYTPGTKGNVAFSVKLKNGNFTSPHNLNRKINTFWGYVPLRVSKNINIQVDIKNSHLLTKNKHLILSVNNVSNNTQILKSKELGLYYKNKIDSTSDSAYTNCKLLSYKIDNSNTNQVSSNSNIEILPKEKVELTYLCYRNYKNNTEFSGELNFQSKGMFSNSYNFILTSS